MPVVVLALIALGCSSEEKPSGAPAERTTPAPAPAEGPPPAAKPDSQKAAPSRAPRDSAFGPRMEVDSTGKLRPIPKPAPKARP